MLVLLIPISPANLAAYLQRATEHSATKFKTSAASVDPFIVSTLSKQT